MPMMIRSFTVLQMTPGTALFGGSIIEGLSISTDQSFRNQPRPEDLAAVEQLVRATGVFSEAEIAIARELVEENLAKGDEASGYRFIFAGDSDDLEGYTCFGPISGT